MGKFNDDDGPQNDDGQRIITIVHLNLRLRYTSKDYTSYFLRQSTVFCNDDIIISSSRFQTLQEHHYRLTFSLSFANIDYDVFNLSNVPPLIVQTAVTVVVHVMPSNYISYLGFITSICK